MKIRHKETGQFIALDIDRMKSNADPHPWYLVDGEENGTIDPGWLGEDLTMSMLAVLPRGIYECVPQTKERAHASSNRHHH